MSTESDGPVRIEILARKDCPSRGMAIAVVEKVVAETGVPAEVEVVDMTSYEQARTRRFLGSPTVRVEGRDVDQRLNGRTEFTLGDRVYRTDRGLAGWPDEEWVREALLLAVAQTTTNGNHESSKSSATSP
ncbi:MAG: DF family (seleno)protein [Gaiellaceae bacterium]